MMRISDNGDVEGALECQELPVVLIQSVEMPHQLFNYCVSRKFPSLQSIIERKSFRAFWKFM